ncbi:MAG: hypothetical protein ACJAVI_004101 [Candidatus Azotimanducaceae bacterium]|jgi:hypothetical protein
MQQHEADYLVIGTGAVGMAFVDTLLEESKATVIMVDSHHQPGGHWNDAYPFVRLHQPSHFYGVASTPLGSMRIDEAGSNAGYFELATGNEVQSYFEQVMRERFLASGRVQYFPMCEYLADGQFCEILSGEKHEVKVGKKIVDSTFFKTSVPSRHKRPFNVADGVSCTPPNSLPTQAGDHKHYCIIGAGKTAMDSAVWLLNNGASPDAISWVCPRRSWMINREVTQAHSQFFVESIGGFARQMKAFAEATSEDDLFDRLEDSGFMLRIDETKRPSMFHFATISRGEVQQLKRIDHIIEQGRVSALTSAGLVMQDESKVSMPEGTLFIDCTASAIDFTFRGKRPVFEDGCITIQAMRVPNPCLSAAMIAFVEANYDTDQDRNRICSPVPLPDNQADWLVSQFGNMMNQAVWSGEPALSDWITNCRLDSFSAVIQGADKSNPEHVAILEMMSSHVMPAITNLQKLMAASAA